MQEAMTVIAEIRDSERLRQFIASGQDRTTIIMHISQHFPHFFFGQLVILLLRRALISHEALINWEILVI